MYFTNSPCWWFRLPISRSGDAGMKRSRPTLLALALLCSRLGSATLIHAAQAGPQEAFFKSKILPIFTTRCQSCHNHTLKLSGLSLESAASMEQGGTHGPVIVPGNPQQSRLYRRVARMEKPFMPMEGEALPEAELASLKTWIEQ